MSWPKGAEEAFTSLNHFKILHAMIKKKDHTIFTDPHQSASHSKDLCLFKGSKKTARRKSTEQSRAKDLVELFTGYCGLREHINTINDFTIN